MHREKRIPLAPAGEEDRPSAGGAGDGALAAGETAMPDESAATEEVEAYQTEEELTQALLDDATEADLAAVMDADEAPDPTDEPEADEADPESEAHDEEDADEPEAEESEGAEDDPDAEDEPEDADAPEDVDFKDIPKEHRPAVRKLLASKVSERVGKEIAKTRAVAEERDALQAEQTTLAAELTELKARKATPTVATPEPLADVTTPDDLRAAVEEAHALNKWLDLNLPTLNSTRENPETGEPEPVKLACPYTGTELDFATAQRLKAQVYDDLVAAPQKAQYFEANRKFDAWLNERVPSLKDRTSALSQAVNEAIAQVPELKRKPGYRASALYYTLGRKLVESAGENGDVEALFNRLSTEQAPRSTEAPAAKPVAEKGAKKQFPRKPRARPVPAMRKVPPSTQRRQEPDSYNTMDELTESLMAS